MLLSPLLVSNCTCQIDSGRCCVNGTHHADTGTCVKTEMLCDSGNFICRQHNAETEKRVRLHRDQSHHEERCLHKRRKAKCHDLLAPACESFGHTSRKAEEIQTAHGDLREQDTPSLDICKEAFDHAVAQADQDEEIEQDVVLPNDRRLVDSQYIESQVLNVEIHSDCLVRQIFCEGILEVHREPE